MIKATKYLPIYRIIDLFGLEGIFEGHLVQSPCCGQEDLQHLANVEKYPLSGSNP